jgi:membrane protein implicated in regulation of membrane protease activity
LDLVVGVLDLGIDLDLWPWIWLGIAVVFAIVELTVLAGTFVLLPFAVSAFLAAIIGFYDVAIEIQWAVFLGGGCIMWVLLYRYVKRFADQHDLPPGVGADRLIGLTGIVTATIDPDDTVRSGRVSVLGETWGALSANEQPIAERAKVRVVRMDGTRIVVEPLSAEGTESS